MEFLGGVLRRVLRGRTAANSSKPDSAWCRCAPCSRDARIEFFEFLAERLIISIDIARGEPDVRNRIDALAERHAHTHADTDGTWAVQVGALAYQDGTLGSMVTAIATMTDGPHSRTWHAGLRSPS